LLFCAGKRRSQVVGSPRLLRKAFLQFRDAWLHQLSLNRITDYRSDKQQPDGN